MSNGDGSRKDVYTLSSNAGILHEVNTLEKMLHIEVRRESRKNVLDFEEVESKVDGMSTTSLSFLLSNKFISRRTR